MSGTVNHVGWESLTLLGCHDPTLLLAHPKCYEYVNSSNISHGD